MFPKLLKNSLNDLPANAEWYDLEIQKTYRAWCGV